MDKAIYIILDRTVSLLNKIPLRTGALLGKLIGTIWFYLDKKHRKITIDNISNAYGAEISRERINSTARKVFCHMSRTLFEYAWFYNKDLKNYPDYFSFKGLDHLKAAHAKKRGVLCLSGHMGNWELLTAISNFTGLPLTGVYRKIKSKAVDLFMKEKREKLGGLGGRLYPLHKALRGIKEAIARGGIILLLMDQNTGHKKGVFVNFFGRKACSNPGLAKLALKTGAPVVPLFIYRENNGLTIEIQPELPLIQTGDEKKDILENTGLYNKTIEEMIRRFPDQWLWIHRRWKTRPLDEKQM